MRETDIINTDNNPPKRVYFFLLFSPMKKAKGLENKSKFLKNLSFDITY